ncbi:jg25197 [Pararge aegeria aegeria]|uniref:Jg25197 protein n=1 Tax=Pararge aegeria aegeria TaxID=348720 RepID=A0A8S4RVM9_9NEOP|nr:jg25197 [Pararge aegeria aegeria]
MTDYDKLVDQFYKRLAEQRQYNQLVYNFSPPEDGELTGLARLCNEVADNIQFVSNLTVGEQLEYGLF